MSNELTIPQISHDISLVEIRADVERFPRLHRIPAPQALHGIKQVVFMALMYRGQAASEENISFISTALLAELLEENKFGTRYLTMEEIARVVKKAALATETFGISVSTLYSALVKYCCTEGKDADNKAKDLYQKKDGPPEAMISVATYRMIEENKKRMEGK